MRYLARKYDEDLTIQEVREDKSRCPNNFRPGDYVKCFDGSYAAFVEDGAITHPLIGGSQEIMVVLAVGCRLPTFEGSTKYDVPFNDIILYGETTGKTYFSFSGFCQKATKVVTTTTEKGSVLD